MNSRKSVGRDCLARTFALVFLGVMMCGVTLGGPVLLHYGATNPELEGWEPDPGIGTGVTTVAPILNDGGYDAWFVSDNAASVNGSSDGYWGSLTPAQKAVADTWGWRFRSRLRVANAPDTGLGSVAIYYFDGITQWLLDFESGPAGEQIVTAVSGTGFSGISFNTGSPGYHLYEMVYDPTSGTTDVLVDGIERIWNWTGISNPIQTGRFKFGSASSPDSGQGNYNTVEFSVVPIPSSFLLVATGGLSILLARRKT